MILGVFDLVREAPQDATLAESCGFLYAVAVDDGVYSLPSLTKGMTYTMDEPDLKGLVPNRTPPPGTYTTIWGGTFGLGLWRWRNQAQFVGTECYGDWRRWTAWISPLLKLAVAALVWRGRRWALCINAYTPVNTQGGTVAVTGLPEWALRRWAWLAERAGAWGVFVLGWGEAEESILAAWPPDVR